MTVSSRRYYFNWETIAVTAVPPGWVTVYYDEDTREYFTEPVLALLLQEATTRSVCWDETDAAGQVHLRDRTERIDRETRVVPGESTYGLPLIEEVGIVGRYHRAMDRETFDRDYAGKLADEHGYPIQADAEVVAQ